MPRTLLLTLALMLISPVHAEDRPLVFTSVLPLRTLVEQVGGSHVGVASLVQPGQSPHAFEPSARQVAELARASLYVRAGLGFEDAWMERLTAVNPDMEVLDLREGLTLRTLEAHDHGHEGHAHHHGHDAHDDSGPDPHIWTSPLLLKQMSLAVRDVLIRLDPAHRASYEANQAALAAELHALDAELRGLLASAPSRRFLVYHPAWGYFADTYGLTQIAIEREGKEPGARALAALVEQARREGVKMILVQPQMNRKAAEQVAGAIGGTVASADPLSPDYAGSLRQVARLIAGKAQ
jgi:zinc transport system substrate-binding protein